MSHPILPPDGKAFISSAVMFQLGLPVPIRDTYAALRVLAWGRPETPVLHSHELEQYTGKDFKTLYRHLPVLASYGVLRVRHAGAGLYQVLFTDGVSGAMNGLKIENSQNRELPIKESDSKLTLSKTLESSSELKDSVYLKIENSQNRESSPATTQAIASAYVSLLGYDPGQWANGESKAAKWIGQHYTVDQFRAGYQYFKAQPFWHDKRLSLRYLQTHLPEYLLAQERAKGHLHATPIPPDDSGQLERDLQLKAERSEQRTPRA